MDYSKLSDFEINGLVASLTQRIGDHTQAREKTFIHEYVDCGEIKQACIGWKEFDPCNNPADAWPIIVENRIRVNPVLYTKWMAEDYLEVISLTNDNPLRAAMIVFLMIQEGK